MAIDPLLPYGEVLGTTVRVATWNVWTRSGPWKQREAVLLDVLGETKADIVCLQEAWAVGDETQAQRFGDALGMHHVEEPGLELEGVISSQAILSRWPIELSRGLDLEGFDGGEGGGAVFARIDGPRGPLDVVSLILDWRLDLGHVRSRQLRTICGWARGLSDPFNPLFLCGDFNATPDSDELRALVGTAPVHEPRMVFYDAVAMAADGDTATFSARNPFAAAGLYPEKQLDHIFSHWSKAHGAGHPVAAAIIGSQPQDGLYASDHFGVVADLRY